MSGCPRGCCGSYREHVASVTVAPSATPSRNPEAADTLTRERQLVKDRDAYKALRKQGVQPKQLRFADEIATRAHDAVEVERAVIFNDKERATVKALQADGAA